MQVEPLTGVLVLLYLMMIGYLGYRGFQGTKNVTDYLVAGRQIHPFVMALSYGATFISTSAIVGFGGAAAVFGMGLLWLTFLNIFVGIFIAFVFLGGRTRAMGHHLGAHTFPELLGLRFQSKFIQVFCGLVIILFMPLYTGVVSMGIARFMEVEFGISYEVALFFFTAIVAVYVVMGGLKGVMYTDAMQGSLMFIGMVILVALTYWKLGGIVEAHQRLTDLAHVAVGSKLGQAGHLGWTAMPDFGSKYWWILVSTIIMGVGIGVLAQPQLAVRYMTVKSRKELNHAVLVGGIFILIMTGVAFVVGALSNVYFLEDEAFKKPAIAAAEGVVGKIIPLFISTYMPSWLGAIIFVTLLAAAMSTVSSQFHAMGTAAGRDVYETLTGKSGGGGTILTTRIGIVLTLLFSTALAWVLPIVYKEAGATIIASGTALFFGLCCSTFLPMYIGALYWRGITMAGAILGSLAGFLVSAFWLVFAHQKESEALLICAKITGKPSIFTTMVDGAAKPIVTGPIMWPEVDPLFVAFPVAIVVTIVVSLITKGYSKEHLDNCFSRIK